MRTFITFAFCLAFILALAHSRAPKDSVEQLKMAEEYINSQNDFQQTEEKPKPGKE